MSEVPSLPYTEIVKALEQAGWTVTPTLSHILKQAGLSVEEFNELL